MSRVSCAAMFVAGGLKFYDNARHGFLDAVVSIVRARLLKIVKNKAYELVVGLVLCYYGCCERN